MRLNEINENLIKEFYKRENNLNFDGAIDEEMYKKSNPKILYILKECWGNDKDFSIVKALNESICTGDKFETHSLMFDRLSEWSYGILNNIYDYEKVVKELKKEKSYQWPLCYAALINISKEITPSSYTQNERLRTLLEKNKELIKKEIELYNPDLIITGGVLGKYGIADMISSMFKNKTEWIEGGANGARIIEINGKKVGLISMCHPAVKAGAEDEFHMVMRGWKNIKDRLKNESLLKEFLDSNDLSNEELDLLFKYKVIYNLDFKEAIAYLKDAKIVFILAKLKEDTSLEFLNNIFQEIDKNISDECEVFLFNKIGNEEKVEVLIAKNI